jgi:Flp pilus assembly protein TadG
MLKQTLHSETRGVVLLETALAFVFLFVTISFALDASMVLYRYSFLTTTTEGLTRSLGVSLGHAISSNTIGGNCDAFLKRSGNSYLAAQTPVPSLYSMTDTTAYYFFTATVVSDPSSPYAILRVQGTLKPSCIICAFFPRATNSSESSALVEYTSNSC